MNIIIRLREPAFTVERKKLKWCWYTCASHLIFRVLKRWRFSMMQHHFEGIHVHTCGTQFLVSFLCHQPSYQFSLSPTKPEVAASFSVIDSVPIIRHSLPLTAVAPSQRINKCIRDFHLLCHLCCISEDATGGLTLSTFAQIFFKDPPDVPSCGHFCFIRKPLQQLLAEETKPQKQLFDINL